MPLPTIPLIDAPAGPLELARLRAADLPRILDRTQEILPTALLRWGDRRTVAWLDRAGNPYRGEIEAVAALAGRPGGHMLNLSFEWGCTTACQAPVQGAAMRLLRTLDWPFRLGAEVVVARHIGAAGAWFNVTWPGLIGVLTGLASGRFAAAINQAPLSFSLGGFGLTMPVDWAVNRIRIMGRTAIPPAHLLRQVFDTAPDYASARRILAETPLCIPAIFILTGTAPDEGCVIERREADGFIHDGPTASANHWQAPGFRGRTRPIRSRDRLAAMRAAMPGSLGDFDWLTPPILNGHTRLAAELDAGTGRLRVQGWHGDVPVTEPLALDRLSAA